MTGMGLSSAGMSLFFAATVLVVFGGGMLTGPLVRRFGAPRIGMAGMLMALVGGIWLVAQADGSTPVPFMAAVTVFLAGMGLVNPVATGLALEPFGDRASIASGLLGFLQMACAAIGTAMIGALPLTAAAAFAWVVLGGTTLATIAFYLHYARIARL
jgi:DHA1 family bicyclomycin/chloramphenicol resistance-like MFS transporter